MNRGKKNLPPKPPSLFLSDGDAEGIPKKEKERGVVGDCPPTFILYNKRF
jgi:hypothetical protein